MKTQLFVTEPHGAQEVVLIDDGGHTNPGNFIFELRDGGSGRIAMTGEEIDSLCEWWTKKRFYEVWLENGKPS